MKNFLPHRPPFLRAGIGFLLSIFSLVTAFSQILSEETQSPDPIYSEEDAFFIRSLYSEAMSSQQSFALLEELIRAGNGPRMSGTENYQKAADWAAQKLKEQGWDEIYNLPAEVKAWSRGRPECVLMGREEGTELSALALGGSGNSGEEMIWGKVIEFTHIDSLRKSDLDLSGKIVFVSGQMDDATINPFRAYGAAVAQRVFAPIEAAKRGALACLVRSMTGRKDDIPHTGTMARWPEGMTPIPALALSVEASQNLQQRLADEEVEVGVFCNARMLEPVMDNTVVAEIRGSQYADEIILAGGHLDSWDVGEGAHDDGAGCVHAMEAFALLRASGYVPKRTWRCVLFANEESGLAGGREYARWSDERREFHLAAIESDAGGHSPTGFTFDSDSLLATYMQAVAKFWPLLDAYHLNRQFYGSGADINPLKSQGGLLIGLLPQPQRYFDLHHSRRDVLAEVHPRELSLGTAAIASLIYLIDKYGLD